jgi:hypothetical protein
VCLAFHGRPPKLDIADVLHLDYNQRNCAASNLLWAVDDVAEAYRREKYYRDLAMPEHYEGRVVRTKPEKQSRTTKIMTTNPLPVMQPLKYLDDLEDRSDL